jgi:hypothetical protein
MGAASKSGHAWERIRSLVKSGWISPIGTNEKQDPLVAAPDSCVRRIQRRASVMQMSD